MKTFDATQPPDGIKGKHEPRIHVASIDAFINKFEILYQSGLGVVPLVGAGISVPSGVPVGLEMVPYLQYCIGFALGLPNQKTHTGCRWHPTLAGWPELLPGWQSSVGNVEKALNDRILKAEKSLAWGFPPPCAKKGSTTPPGEMVAPTSPPACPPAAPAPALHEERPLLSAELQILQRAGRVMGDWMEALQFIASIVPPVDEETPLALQAPNSHIVDSFFAYLTSGRLPAITHRLLAHFARSLRARVTLTLNFDNLLEQAHADAELRSEVFEVTHSSGLPTWSLLGSGCAIVKMHGGKFSLRADATLDLDPLEADRWSFRSYLMKRDWTAEDEDRFICGRKRPRAQAILLIMGFSGRDRRILLLLKDALAHLRDLTILFVAHSQDTQDSMLWYCRSLGFHGYLTGREGNRLLIVQHSQPGPLLLDLYQQIMHCMPPAGIAFPVTWRLSLVPRPEPKEYGARECLLVDFINHRKKCEEWLRDQRKLRSEARQGQCTVLTIRDCSEEKQDRGKEWGIRPFGWDLFHGWSASNHCIWLSLVHCRDLNDLKLRIHQAVENALGLDHRLPRLVSFEDDPTYFDDLQRLLSKTARPWVIILNLRGRTGSAADVFDSIARKALAQLSIEETNQHIQQNFAPLALFIRELIKTMNIVVLRYAHEPLAGLIEADTAASHQGSISLTFTNNTKTTKVDFARHRADWAHQWSSKPKSKEERDLRRRILLALATFPLIRHFTALVARSVAGPGMRSDQPWQDLWEKIKELLQELVQKKVVRRAAGGFLWLHPRVREELRNQLVKTPGGANRPESLSEREDLHTGLADWCMTLFASTSDPLAAFQSVYHRCRIVELATERLHTGIIALGPEEIQREKVRIRESLCEALNALETAKARLLAWRDKREAESCLEALVRLLDDLFARAELTGIRNQCFYHLQKAKVLMYQAEMYRDLGWPTEVLKVCGKFREFIIQHEASFAREAPAECCSLKFRYQLQEALAHVALRCYPEAQVLLVQLVGTKERGHPFPLEEVCPGIKDEPIPSILTKAQQKEPHIEDIIADWLDKMGDPENNEPFVSIRFTIRRLIFTGLRRLMELQLLRYEIDLVKNQAGLGQSQADSLQSPWLIRAQRLYRAARALLRSYPEEEMSEYRVERSRLHSVLAGVLVMKGDFNAVPRHLHEARAAAKFLMESEQHLARVVVDLREAYFRLHDIMREREGSMSALIRVLMGELKTPGWQGKFQSLALDTQKVQGIAANLEGIQLILQRINASMSRHRKTLWWWMTHRRYQMLCWMLQEVLRHKLQPSEGNLPHTLLRTWETAVKGSAFLGECARRLTSDVLQLARISHTALILAQLGRDTHLLPKSPEFTNEIYQSWHKPLRFCHQRLQALLESHAPQDPSLLDPNVEQYCCYVRDQIDAFINDPDPSAEHPAQPGGGIRNPR